MILAVNGYHSLSSYKRALSPQWVCVCTGGTLPQILQAILLGPLMSNKEGKNLGSMGLAKVNQEDLVYLGELLESGKVVPVINKCYPLSEVSEAMRFLVEEHAKGKVVIQIS